MATRSCSLPDIFVYFGTESRWLAYREWGTCCKTVQDVGAKIDIIGPDEGTCFDVNTYLLKERRILKRAKDPAAPNDPVGEIDLALFAITKLQL
jgi:hypothetical protein